MRLSASLGFLSSLALGCAGASELSAGDGRTAPTGAAAHAVADPAPASTARTTAPGEPNAAATRSRAPSRDAASEAPPFDARFTDEVRAVLAAYEAWGRVDDEMRWAPWLCRMPMAASARWSESGHADTHGAKLYTLYALDPVGYGAQRSAMGEPAKLSGLSQVIVKESFAPEPLEGDGKSAAWNPHGIGEHRLRPAEKDGRQFVAGERRGLYIMMKTEGAAEGTDAGWVYATVDADMATVTAVGVIDSCAGCHAEAGDDRLFGLPGPGSGKNAENAVPL